MSVEQHGWKQKYTIRCDYPECPNKVTAHGKSPNKARRDAERRYMFLRDGDEDFCFDHAERAFDHSDEVCCPHCGGKLRIST